MKSKVVIFGGGEIAQVALYYLTQEAKHEVIAFSLHQDFCSEETALGLPVIPFEELQNSYPPSDFKIFIAMGYSGVNQGRADVFREVKNSGYSLVSYISPLASIATGVVIGENCFILEDNTIQPFVEIGDNVTLWSGNHIGHHSRIGNNVFISSHVVVSGGVSIGDQSFLGVNSTLRDHIVIGERSVIGAGSLIMKDTKPGGVYLGVPTERRFE